MIIEFFGPPGAGKTTFALALADRLRGAGCRATLVLSYRPGEARTCVDAPAARPKHHRAAAARLIRPAVEVLRMMGQPGEILCEGGIAIGLIRAMPPRSLVSSVKMGQYIARLAHSWRLASQLTEVALFDQGFMQVIYSLTLLSPAPNEASIVNALDRIPKSNLLIRLDAPNQTLRLRLHERLGHQGAIERLLEPDVNTIVESKHIADHLSRLLRERGQLVFEATSVDRHSLCENVEQVWHRIKSEVLPRAPRLE